jgi:hypothetical protein
MNKLQKEADISNDYSNCTLGSLEVTLKAMLGDDEEFAKIITQEINSILKDLDANPPVQSGTITKSFTFKSKARNVYPTISSSQPKMADFNPFETPEPGNFFSLLSDSWHKSGFLGTDVNLIPMKFWGGNTGLGKTVDGGTEPNVFADDNPIRLLDINSEGPGDPRTEFYKTFGEPLIKKFSNISTANKFKALYIIAQKREESGFKLTDYHGNVYNITGKGDKGSVRFPAPEYNKITKKYELVPQDYAVYSSNDAAGDAYINLVSKKPGYKEAWNALTNDNATIDDFAKGLKDGGYATAPDYDTKVENVFKGVVWDYKNMITSQISENQKQISANNEIINSKKSTTDQINQAKKSNGELNESNTQLNSDLQELNKLK